MAALTAYLLIWSIITCSIVKYNEAKSQCSSPAIPIYATATFSNKSLSIGSTVAYKCDAGYELFGSAERTCQENGRWTNNLPYCALNVAYGKPSNQSSTARGGEARNANDGDLSNLHENQHCSETKVEGSPWWQVDLLQPYEVKVVRVLSRACCGHQPLHDIEIRVGNSSTVQNNRLCAWHPGTLDEGAIKDFDCAIPITGRFVHIQMVGIEASLSLCEVLVFTSKEFAAERCATDLVQDKLVSFNRTCYEFQIDRGGSFNSSAQYCQERGGLLIHSINEATHDFLYSELERNKSKLKSRLVWIGARREMNTNTNSTAPSFHKSRAQNNNIWKWVTGKAVNKFLWASDQPNNYNGMQNCMVLDGGRSWYWNDVTCDLDYLPWICTYYPTTCGSPDKKENSTLVMQGQKIDDQIVYTCPPGSVLIGNSQRTCLSTGFWSGSAPSCKYVDCGRLPPIENGNVITYRTDYMANATYTCDPDFILIGEEQRQCLSTGLWSGQEGKCVYKWCPQLSSLPNGQLTLTNRTSNGLATYECNKGHKLIGNKERTCLLTKNGYRWTPSGEEPVCKFIDCGMPPHPRHGRLRTLTGSTTYMNVIRYDCDTNYVLQGNSSRMCTEFGTWSGIEPTCRLITCGKPEVPSGSELIGDRFTVNSLVQFKCKLGHKMTEGDGNLVCNLSGQWEGIPTVCKFIDCGRVPILLKGEVKYLNQSTYLGSQIGFVCSAGYRLTGAPIRTCQDDGKWSNLSPKCEEIRCLAPDMPPNSSVSYSGNDRSSTESFKIGSTVQYRCSAGHTVIGQSLRTCEVDATWTGTLPSCKYVECGLPDLVSNGRWLVNTTHYGSIAEYECDYNYRLSGPARRICLENGTWSSASPTCELVNCGRPNVHDKSTKVFGVDYSVNAKVNYSCEHGYQLVGEYQSFCLPSGQWSSQAPFCKVVDCNKPPVLAYGKVILLNGTTTFESVARYTCLPDYKMIGDPHRRCLANGLWSNHEPRCIELSFINEMDGNNLDSSETEKSNLQMEGSKTLSISIAIGLFVLLILVMTSTVLCLKSKKPQPVKNTENVDVNGAGAKDSATVMSYSRLSLESEAHNQLLSNVTGIRHHHPGGLVTFSSSSNGFGHQPIYANTRSSSQIPVMPIKPIMSKNNSDFKSNHLQQIIGENTTPRFLVNNSSTMEV